MVNGINSSQVPYSGYPGNAVGANSTTKDIASFNYDTQRTNIAKTYNYLTTEDKQSYKWPIIGLLTSAVALFLVKRI